FLQLLYLSTPTSCLIKPFFAGPGIAYGMASTYSAGKDRNMKNLWLRCSVFAAFSLAGSAALGNAFAGPNPDTQPLTWSGFSNGSVGVSLSTTGGTNPFGVNAGQFKGLFDG